MALFSGLISKSPQRRTCVCPPLLYLSLLNLTGTAGHRQPIKLGLRGYLHTRLQQEKLENTHSPALLPFTNSFSSFFLVAHSSHPSLYFTLLPCLYPPFASSFQSPHPVSSSHNGGIQKVPILSGDSSAPCLLATRLPLYSGS